MTTASAAQNVQFDRGHTAELPTALAAAGRIAAGEAGQLASSHGGVSARWRLSGEVCAG